MSRVLFVEIVLNIVRTKALPSLSNPGDTRRVQVGICKAQQSVDRIQLVECSDVDLPTSISRTLINHTLGSDRSALGSIDVSLLAFIMDKAITEPR